MCFGSPVEAANGATVMSDNSAVTGQGDSGGPVVCEASDGNLYLFGIIASGLHLRQSTKAPGHYSASSSVFLATPVKPYLKADVAGNIDCLMVKP